MNKTSQWREVWAHWMSCLVEDVKLKEDFGVEIGPDCFPSGSDISRDQLPLGVYSLATKGSVATEVLSEPSPSTSTVALDTTHTDCGFPDALFTWRVEEDGAGSGDMCRSHFDGWGACQQTENTRASILTG